MKTGLKVLLLTSILCVGIVAVSRKDVNKNSGIISQKEVKSSFNYYEIEYQIKVALQQLFEDIYGNKVYDARMYIEKIYTKEEEKQNELLKDLNLKEKEYAFELRYELKPASGVNPNELITSNGVYNEESGWITDIERVGVLRFNQNNIPNYQITNFGTSF